MSFPDNTRSLYVVATFQVQDTGHGLQDYDESIFDELIAKHVAYIHAGREKGSHKHWQCYFEAPTPWSGKQWKERFPHARLAVAKGTAEQCIDYQSKEDDHPFTHGVWRNKGRGGKRKGSAVDQYAEFRDLVRTGVRAEELWLKHPRQMMMYRNAAADIRSAFAKAQDTMPETWILWGDTSTGKSFMAAQDKAENIDYAKGAVQNYSGLNEVVAIQEFDHHEWPIQLVLRIIDEYEVTVNVKFGTANWNAKRIIITSNEDPDTWWQGRITPEQKDAFFRKIKDGGGGVIHMTVPYVKGSGEVRALPIPLWKRSAPQISENGSQNGSNGNSGSGSEVELFSESSEDEPDPKYHGTYTGPNDPDNWYANGKPASQEDSQEEEW